MAITLAYVGKFNGALREGVYGYHDGVGRDNNSAWVEFAETARSAMMAQTSSYSTDLGRCALYNALEWWRSAANRITLNVATRGALGMMVSVIVLVELGYSFGTSGTSLDLGVGIMFLVGLSSPQGLKQVKGCMFVVE